MFVSGLILILLFNFFVPYLFHILCRYKNKRLLGSERALLVIAHPDDEVMFFGPTILGLQQRGVQLKILCLSRGDFYGQGERREKEMINSCVRLGIKRENVTVINDDNLPDNPKIKWPSDKISTYVHAEILQYTPDIVITFDDHGVSGHSNHGDVGKGIRNLLRVHQKNLKDIKFYELESTSVFNKYTGGLTIFWSYLLNDVIFVSTASLLIKTMRAFLCHRSQLFWFRFLYFAFSRFTLVNTLIPVQTEA